MPEKFGNPPANDVHSTQYYFEDAIVPQNSWDVILHPNNLSIDPCELPTLSDPGPCMIDVSTQEYMLLDEPTNVTSSVALTTESRSDVLALLPSSMGEISGILQLFKKHNLMSHLDDLTVGRRDANIDIRIPMVQASSMVDSVVQLLRYTVYLASNNLLSIEILDRLVQWMERTGGQWALNALLNYNTPTIKIFGENMLVSAARMGHANVVRNLLAFGININAIAGQWDPMTALQAAVVFCQPRVLQMLLDAGADTLPQRGSWHSVLHDAVFGKNCNDVVRVLIEKGADVNGPYDEVHYKRTVLATAASRCDCEMVCILLKAGSDLNETRNGSINALQSAISSENIEVVRSLIDAGADIDYPTAETFTEMCVSASYFDGLQTPIQRAAAANNTDIVQILVSKGVDVNACPECSRHMLSTEHSDIHCYCHDRHLTALQEATCNKNTMMVRILLGAGADVDKRGAENNIDIYDDEREWGEHTPLQIAAALGNEKIARILLKHGADVNAPASDHGETALQAAVSGNCVGLVQLLLDAGAYINADAGRTSGRTALQAAVTIGNTELVYLLFQAGANINAYASEFGGRTCLQAAVENSDLELVRWLLERGAEVNSPAAMACEGVTALQAALLNLYESGSKQPYYHRHPSYEILTSILEAGADINAPSSLEIGITALEASVESKDSELVSLLLRKGANPNHRTLEYTAIGAAIEEESVEILLLLIAAGADINTCVLDGQTAIEAAASQGSMVCVEALVDAGVNIDRDAPSTSMTVLQLAAKRGHLEMLKFLMTKGADPNAYSERNSCCSTALNTACSTQPINVNTIMALLEAGADANGKSAVSGHEQLLPLTDAVEAGSIEAVQLLLSAGAKVNAPVQVMGRTPLQMAAQTGHIGLLRLLLTNGADVNAPATSDHGVTALQAAAINGHLKVALILLEAGADINAPAASYEGRTALDGAAENGRLDIVHLLLMNDHDIQGLPGRCLNAAEYAATKGHRLIADILRDKAASASQDGA